MSGTTASCIFSWHVFFNTTAIHTLTTGFNSKRLQFATAGHLSSGETLSIFPLKIAPTLCNIVNMANVVGTVVFRNYFWIMLAELLGSLTGVARTYGSNAKCLSDFHSACGATKGCWQTTCRRWPPVISECGLMTAIASPASGFLHIWKKPSHWHMSDRASANFACFAYYNQCENRFDFKVFCKHIKPFQGDYPPNEDKSDRYKSFQRRYTLITHLDYQI